MKNLKQHRVQILAAIALAFSLGMVVPGAVFASEENAEASIEAQSAVVNASSEQLMALVTAIKGEKDYDKYEALYAAQIALAEDLDGASEAKVLAARQAVVALTPEAQVGDLDAKALNAHILGMTGYSDWSAMFTTMKQLEKEVEATLSQEAISEKLSQKQITNYYNNLNKFVNRVQGTLAENVAKLFVRISTRDSFKGFRDAAGLVEATEKVATLKEDATEAEVNAAVAALKAQLADVEGSATMTAEQLVKAARETKGYANYKSLYDAMGFVNKELQKLDLAEGDDVEAKLAAALAVTYDKKQAALTEDYGRMATAAVKIDDTVMVGLMPAELPTAGVGTPDTGIVGLIESGALDMGTVMLVVSLAAAGVIGLGVIVRLYTRKSMLRK